MVFMQLSLPIFPSGSTLISDVLGVHCQDKIIYWVVNSLPIYQHKQDDHQSFRFAISNFIKQGLCRKVDVMRTFHVSGSFVHRACKKLATEGGAGFFGKTGRKGSNHVIVESVREHVQGLLDEGRSVNSIAEELHLSESTIRNKIKQGYLKKKIKPRPYIPHYQTRQNLPLKG
jgi:hypothetical protein